MAKIGSEGVLALLSESTNAERPGFTPSERSVGERIEEIFMKANRKVIISTFASNVNRVQQIVEACIKTNRKLALLGKYGKCSRGCSRERLFTYSRRYVD